MTRLARATGIPRPTVYRLLDQLIEERVVERSGPEYRLSTDMLALSHQVETTAGLRAAATDVVRALRDQTGGMVSLVVPSGGRYVALEMIPGRQALPFDGYDGAVMLVASAAEVSLDPRCAPGRRLARWGSAVDEESVAVGITCYAVAISLPGNERAALQVASPVALPARTFAPMVHRAASMVAKRAARRRA